MYFFYVDETGNRNPRVEIMREGGERSPMTGFMS